MSETLNTARVAVSDRNGGFHIFQTGGTFDPRLWINGRLNGAHWLESREALDWECASVALRPTRHADYLQLVSVTA